jgi:hypothetical protein
MLAKLNDTNIVIFVFLLFASLASVTQFDAVDIRQMNIAGVVDLSKNAIVPSPYRPSVLVLTRDQDMTALQDDPEFRTVSKYWFSAIGVGVVEIAVSQNQSEGALIGQLSNTFPSLIVGPNESVVPLGTSFRNAVEDSSRRLGYRVCNSNERIGVIDGPVNADHVQFEGHSIVSKSFVANGDASSDLAHSTGVLSILVDTYAQGSSQPLNILVGEILEYRDAKAVGSLLSVVRALDWLVGQGATVVNMSFQAKENAVFSKVLDKVAESGTIMVAAAGNKGSGIVMNFPAAHPKVLAVTAIDSAQNASPNASRGEYIDFAAPGVDVPIATLHGPGRGSGTSYAAPYVTSIVALTLAGGAPRDVDTIRQLVARNAIDLGIPGKDNIFGWGLPKVGAHCGRQQFSRR